MQVGYRYDSLGAPDDYIEDETPIVGNDWRGQDIREDEKVLIYEAYRPGDDNGDCQAEYLFEDDIYEYIKTLERDDLLEILSNVNVEDIKDAGNMEEVYL